jgi:DinB superfamily
MQETVEEYCNRMLGLIEGRHPLKLQASASQKLGRLLKGVSAVTARKRPAPGKWSIAEIVAHIADTELVAGYRIRTILGAPGVPIQAFDQDDWAAALQYRKRDLRRSLEQYRGLRAANLALLKSIKPKQWKQHGLHAERGEENIERIAKLTAGHDINHILQIERILEKKERVGRATRKGLPRKRPEATGPRSLVRPFRYQIRQR